MTMYDYVWLCMNMYDYVRLCMTMYDYAWLCKTMQGYIWLCMTMYDYAWLCITIYDYARLCMILYFYIITFKIVSESTFYKTGCPKFGCLKTELCNRIREWGWAMRNYKVSSPYGNTRRQSQVDEPGHVWSESKRLLCWRSNLKFLPCLKTCLHHA